jgi:hypothetical protein
MFIKSTTVTDITVVRSDNVFIRFAQIHFPFPALAASSFQSNLFTKKKQF